MSAVTVLTVTFEKNEQAYPAITQLNELDAQDQIKLRAAAVVTRDTAGRIQVKEKIGGPEYSGAAAGGMLGLLIGIIGGPLGMLVAGASGLLLGGAIDLEEDQNEGSVLAEISTRVRTGSDVLLAEVEEQTPEVVDHAMNAMSGTVLRRTLVSVETEMAYAQEVHQQVRSTARRKLHEERKRAHDDKVKAKLAELKAKLGNHSSHEPASRPQPSTSAGSTEERAKVGSQA